MSAADRAQESLAATCRLPRGWPAAAWLLPLVAMVTMVAMVTVAACGASRGIGPTDPAFAAVLPPGVEPVTFKTVEIRLDRSVSVPGTLTVALADTVDRRTRGLMYRIHLLPDSGMLFAFPIETNSPFWNKNTPLDLDIAFLDAGGMVLAVYHLKRFSEELVVPEVLYLYALEMPGGWFALNGVGVGARFLIPDTVEGLTQ